MVFNMANSLQKPIQYLKGVGPRRAQCFRKLGIETVWDLLNHFPREHQDRTKQVPIVRACSGSVQSLTGVVHDFDVVPVGRNLSMGRALLGDPTGSIWAVWFRHSSARYDPFTGLRRQLVKGASILVHGRVERNYRQLQIRVDEYEVLKPGDRSVKHIGRIVPVYDLTEGIDARWLRELIWDVLEKNHGGVYESLPEFFIRENNLASLSWAIRHIHYPASWKDVQKAHERLSFEEFFFLELALAHVRQGRLSGPPAVPCSLTRCLLTPFRQALGFDFTTAQKRVINEIFSDMAKNKPMNRLLQGDVGSGKTVVALAAMLLAVENGQQAALMAPTEILAGQHFLTLEKMLKGLSVRMSLLTSDVSKKNKFKKIEDLKTGKVQIAIGTHALIQENVFFQNLGLVVVDEQHRFGVRQRALFQRKAQAPHVLIMTATPIPRTLSLTLYGDLDVSVIRQLPPGRPGIVTHWTSEKEALVSVHQAVNTGKQAYIVFPLVDESDKLNLRAAVKEWERLKTSVFPGLSVGLLHGRLKSAEKEKTMAGFASGEIKILAATPVIEVGIDVPNACVMVIMNADRFGLAQLHQLRGRVGRGKHLSECFLVSHSKSPDPVRRLNLMCETSDGFQLAEEDLKMRGPGEFLGEAQHGTPLLKAGDLVKDVAIIEKAREKAFLVMREDPCFGNPKNHIFRDTLRSRFANRLFFGQVA